MRYSIDINREPGNFYNFPENKLNKGGQYAEIPPFYANISPVYPKLPDENGYISSLFGNPTSEEIKTPLKSLNTSVEQQTRRAEPIFANMSRFLIHATTSGQIQAILGETARALKRPDELRVVADRGIFGRELSDTDKYGSSRTFPGQGVWYDGSYAFALVYEDKPVSVVSFNQSEGIADIVQIQGVRGREPRRTLHVVGNWEQRMISLVEEYARFARLGAITVQPGRLNAWVRGLGLEKTERRYDKPATDLGFNYSEFLERYVRLIEPSFVPTSGDIELLRSTSRQGIISKSIFEKPQEKIPKLLPDNTELLLDYSTYKLTFKTNL